MRAWPWERIRWLTVRGLAVVGINAVQRQEAWPPFAGWVLAI